MLQEIRADHRRMPSVHLRIGLLFGQDSVVVVDAHAQRASNCTAAALTHAGTIPTLIHWPNSADDGVERRVGECQVGGVAFDDDGFRDERSYTADLDLAEVDAGDVMSTGGQTAGDGDAVARGLTSRMSAPPEKASGASSVR